MPKCLKWAWVPRDQGHLTPYHSPMVPGTKPNSSHGLHDPVRPGAARLPDHIVLPRAPFSPLGAKVPSPSWHVALEHSSFKAPQDCHLLLTLLSQLKPHLCEALPGHPVTLHPSLSCLPFSVPRRPWCCETLLCGYSFILSLPQQKCKSVRAGRPA